MEFKFAENETLELKKSTSELKEAVVSISSILNKHGFGELYFGIKNDGSVVGQDLSEKTLRTASQAISENIEPRIYPEISVVKIEDKNCIYVKFSGDEKPYYAYGRAYKRVGEEDRKLSAKEIETIILQKNINALRWESQPSKTGISEVNEATIKKFLTKANSVGRLQFPYENTETTLHKLELIDSGRMLNAAKVLFCDQNLLEVQAAIFAGTDKITFLDIKQLKGNIFDLLEQTELYLKNHLKWRVKFGKLEREEIPEIPISALREALVNSFCHRDYLIPKSNEIALFKDRVEIYNPGTFPEGLTPKDFIEGGERSVLRNPLISKTLYYSKDVERWGSGLKRIYESCSQEGVSVEFNALKTGFLVAFKRKNLENQEKFPPYPPAVNGAKTGEGISEGINEGINEGTNGGEKRLYQCIKINPGLRVHHLSSALKTPRKTLERWLKNSGIKGRSSLSAATKPGDISLKNHPISPNNPLAAPHKPHTFSTFQPTSNKTGSVPANDP